MSSDLVEYTRRYAAAYWPYALVPLGLYGASRLYSWLLPGPHHHAKLNVRDRTVLITGASSGLGRALAFEFYQRGAKVIVVARGIEKLKELCRDLKAAGDANKWNNPHEPVYLYLDLAELGNEASAKDKIDSIKCLALDGKTIDVLVNNAGISTRGSVLGTPLQVLRQTFEVNFFGHVLVTKLLYDSIPDDGAILVISSVQGKLALPYRSPYSSSKHALEAMFDSLRSEDRPNLQILTISAGYMNTGFGSRALDHEGRPMGVEDDNQAKGLSVEAAASNIIKSLLNRETEYIMAPLHHRLGIYLRRLAPNLSYWLLYKRGQADPHRPHAS